MASINYATREISCKIVYYGPGLSGKTTNLQIIHRKIPVESKSEMVSLATETDRTLFFDFLPLDLGSIKGFATKFQLYTVPGQVYYNATRKLVLRGVDGVVFVADSQRDKMQENVDSLRNLQENLKEYGIDLGAVPFVLQYNKRDLPNVATIVELDQHLNWHKVPTFEAQAHQGVGVFTTLKAIGKIVIDTFNAKYTARQSTRRPSSLPDAQSTISAPPAPAPRPVAPPQAPPTAPAPRPPATMPPPPPRPAVMPSIPPPVQAAPTLPPLPPVAPPRPVAPPAAAPMAMPPVAPPMSAPAQSPFISQQPDAPQFTGFNAPLPPPAQQTSPGLQTDYFAPSQAPAPVAQVPGFLPTSAPIPPAPTHLPTPGLQGFNPPAASAFASTPSLPPSTIQAPLSQASAPSQPDGKQKKSKIDGSIDPSDLDAEIARYERELAEQKNVKPASMVVSNPNVNPNVQGGDPLASAFLTPEELSRLQGADSYPTRRMPLGPGQG
ncbi:MAG: hypothetical protein RL173_1585 [Fibrobacterota bacterium]|jgi:signal recognition particle receptor subunit beta